MLIVHGEVNFVDERKSRMCAKDYGLMPAWLDVWSGGVDEPECPRRYCRRWKSEWLETGINARCNEVERNRTEGTVLAVG